MRSIPVGGAHRLNTMFRPAIRQDPWDIGPDPSRGSPLDTHLAPLPAHPPPAIPGDGVPFVRRPVSPPDWNGVVHTPVRDAATAALHCCRC